MPYLYFLMGFAWLMNMKPDEDKAADKIKKFGIKVTTCL